MGMLSNVRKRIGMAIYGRSKDFAFSKDPELAREAANKRWGNAKAVVVNREDGDGKETIRTRSFQDTLQMLEDAERFKKVLGIGEKDGFDMAQIMQMIQQFSQKPQGAQTITWEQVTKLIQERNIPKDQAHLLVEEAYAKLEKIKV